MSGGQLEAMAAAATAAAMAAPVTVELRDTEGNHYQATRLGLPPVTQIHLVCGVAGCGQSVCCLSYDITAGAWLRPLADIAAHVAAHATQCHTGHIPQLS